MIQKYYEGIIEQVFGRLGRHTVNVTLAKYSNDFSIGEISLPANLKIREDVFFWEYEFEQENMSGPYEPFLDIIREMYHRYETVSLDDFLEKNEIYYLQRPIIKSYLESGACHRQEHLLLGETAYEQDAMTEGILRMFVSLTRIKPCVLVLNRLQLAAKSTIVLLNRILSIADNGNIGIVLGVNDMIHVPEFELPVWEEMLDQLKDKNQVFHIGASEKTTRKQASSIIDTSRDVMLKTITNLVCMLDFEQALYYLDKIDRKMKFENLELEDYFCFELFRQYAYAAIYSSDLAKALEICEDIRSLDLPSLTEVKEYYYFYLSGNVFMYQGRLFEAMSTAKKAQEIAVKISDDKRVFLAELLEIQTKMSGWSNIFFCARDVEVPEHIFEKLEKYHYLNHMAYVYVYAYDNDPEVVAASYEKEELLVYFSKGMELAKKIGNEHLIYNAYQKNIMLASTNGMYDISMLYSVKTFEAMKDRHSLHGGRIYCGLGYNLSALGQTKKAVHYYQKALQIFYELNLPEDIAEVFYNMALNCIEMHQYQKAEQYLMNCMKTIEKLQLNSLRVCNISKLYGLLALCSAMLGNRFNCERYLHSCKQFLNYVIEKEDKEEIGSIHDYAKCDDDLFLYYFSMALLHGIEERDGEALYFYDVAETHLLHAQGNQFFCYHLFRECRIRLYEENGRMDYARREREILEEYKQAEKKKKIKDILAMLAPVEEYDKQIHHTDEMVPMAKIDELIQQEGVRRAYQMKKRQMDFISTWQRLIDITDVSAETMMGTVMRNFLYHFSVDRALYIRCRGGKTEVLYNNTEKKMTKEILDFIIRCFEEDQRGFAVSKISSNYSEHLNIISLFGEDNVCSMVAIPFLNHGKVDSVLITYVLMKDNWHTSVNRYMLDENDLNIYELLFREVQYSLNRLDAYEKVYEMNARLYQSAITDQLTNIYNRKGFYLRIEEIMQKMKEMNSIQSFALMFIDLDNFKAYNDTFGHDIGDLILKEMAEIFKVTCGRDGFVSRYGGDEFIIFVKTNEKAVLEEMVQEIYHKIEEKNGFEAEIREQIGENIRIDKKKQISCSIGIAGSDYVKSEEDINLLIKEADDLLYHIKTTEKGHYTFM